MSAKYLLPCKCGKEIPVELRQAGQQVRCECGAEHEVPRMQDLRRLKHADAPQPETRPMAKRRWGRRQRLLVVGGVLVLLAALLGVYLYGREPQLNVESLRPWQTVQVWEQFRGGLQGRLPTERAYEEELQKHRRWVYVAVVLGGLGVLTMLSSLFVSAGPPTRRPRPTGSPPGGSPADPTADERAGRKRSRPRPG